MSSQTEKSLRTLGHVIHFIENELGAGPDTLAGNPSMASLSPCFQQTDTTIDASNFNDQNKMAVDIHEFTINSKEYLFSIAIDVKGADPHQGLIALPNVLNSWLKINNLGISFQGKSNEDTPV